MLPRVHKHIDGGHQWLSWALGRERALRGSGILWAEHKYVMPDGATVRVQVTGNDSHVWLLQGAASAASTGKTWFAAFTQAAQYFSGFTTPEVTARDIVIPSNGEYEPPDQGDLPITVFDQDGNLVSTMADGYGGPPPGWGSASDAGVLQTELSRKLWKLETTFARPDTSVHIRVRSVHMSFGGFLDGIDQVDGEIVINTSWEEVSGGYGAWSPTRPLTMPTGAPDAKWYNIVTVPDSEGTPMESAPAYVTQACRLTYHADVRAAKLSYHPSILAFMTAAMNTPAGQTQLWLTPMLKPTYTPVENIWTPFTEVISSSTYESSTTHRVGYWTGNTVIPTTGEIVPVRAEVMCTVSELSDGMSATDLILGTDVDIGGEGSKPIGDKMHRLPDTMHGVVVSGLAPDQGPIPALTGVTRLPEYEQWLKEPRIPGERALDVDLHEVGSELHVFHFEHDWFDSETEQYVTSEEPWLPAISIRSYGICEGSPDPGKWIRDKFRPQPGTTAIRYSRYERFRFDATTGGVRGVWTPVPMTGFPPEISTGLSTEEARTLNTLGTFYVITKVDTWKMPAVPDWGLFDKQWFLANRNGPAPAGGGGVLRHVATQCLAYLGLG